MGLALVTAMPSITSALVGKFSSIGASISIWYVTGSGSKPLGLRLLLLQTRPPQGGRVLHLRVQFRAFMFD